MSATTGTPSWLSGLLIIFAGSTAVTLGLFVYRHTQAAQLSEQQIRMQLLLPDLRAEAARHDGLVAPLDQAIVLRRERLGQLQEAEASNRSDLDGMGTRNTNAAKTLRTTLRKEVSTYGEAMKEAKERRLEVAKEEERQATSGQENDERLHQLRDDVEKQSQALEIQRKKARTDNAVLDQRIAELEDRVRQLTSQIDLSNRAFVPDGTVLTGAVAKGYVVIDRGLRHHLHRDLRFTVYTHRAGRTVTKGVIQVTEPGESIATCRIIEESDPNDPIIPGDVLHNPAYDPDRVRSFVVRGAFTRYTRPEMERLVAAAGGQVDAQLTVDTDYLVAGSGAERDIAQAGKLGVSVLGEEQVLELMPRRSGPDPVVWDYILARCKAGATFGLAGDFTRADRSLVKRAISAQGGSTSGGVSAGYAGLIAGDNAAEAMAEARRLGVPVIDQGQFSQLANRSE